MPFDKLVDMVQAKRELSHDPLFQVFFSLNNNPVWDIKLAGITLAPYFADSGVAKFDLEISLIEWRERLIAKAIFKAALFDTSTIKLMLERYRALLQGIVNDPGERLLNLPIACEEETTTQRTHPTFLNTDEFTFDELAT
jgi:non-ribosomal peptide synthetase component F